MKHKVKAKRPIVLKLIFVISVLVILASSVVTAVSTLRFSEDSKARVEKDVFDLNEILSNQIDVVFSNLNTSIYLLFDTLRNISGDRTLEQISVTNFWSRNVNVATIIVPGEKIFYNKKFFLANEIEESVIDKALEHYKDQQKIAESGISFIFNAAPYFGFPVIGVMQPFKELGKNNCLVVFMSTENLRDIIQGQSLYKNFIVNSVGDLLVHNDNQLINSGASMSEHPVVADLLKSTIDNKQFLYADSDNINYFGAYHKLSVGGIAVISSVPESAIMEVIYKIFRQNLYLIGVVLLFAMLFIYFFSKTFTKPIKRLEEASFEIAEGNYDVKIKPTTRDEIGSLTVQFVNMAKGLAERERIKSTFGKFVNKDIAERALKGELALGGIKKTATIFFSDIRSFTAISEQLLPEKVVEFLNAYMTRMVKCVNESDGVVDKYIGDAIMAIWGAPASKGSPAIDAMNCISAALSMRKALIEFNKDRGSEEKPIIKIGCGINTGDVIAGQIGSEDRMEYTVIGDAVNLASRIEALNKPFGTDILISENTYNLLKDKIIVEPMPPIKVKGKVAPLQIYAVINLVDSGYPETLADVREMVNIQPPQVEVNVEQEEIKYEIINDKKSGGRN